MVNEIMRKSKRTPVYGHVIPSSKWTLSAALLLATVLSVPVFLVLSVVDLLFL
jgi:hypothetical protein